MGSVIGSKSINDYFAEIFARLRKLETGGKPVVGLSGRANFESTLASSAKNDDIAVTLNWNDAGILTNPKGDPYYVIYVDNNLDTNYAWPYGASLSSGQKNLRVSHFMSGEYLEGHANQSRMTMRLENLDGSQHTYYVYIRFVYIKGGSGGGN